MTRIAIFEDDEDFREVLTAQLSNAGHRTHAWGDPRTGIRHLLSEKIRVDLVLLDQVMPGMSGFEVLKKIKENSLTRHLITVMLTGHKDDEAIRKTVALGLDDFLLKPLKFETLHERLAGFDVRLSLDQVRLLLSSCDKPDPSLLTEGVFKRFRRLNMQALRANLSNRNYLLLLDPALSVAAAQKLDDGLLKSQLRVYLDGSPWRPVWPLQSDLVKLPNPSERQQAELKKDLGDELFDLLERHSKLG